MCKALFARSKIIQTIEIGREDDVVVDVVHCIHRKMFDMVRDSAVLALSTRTVGAFVVLRSGLQFGFLAICSKLAARFSARRRPFRCIATNPLGVHVSPQVAPQP